MILLDTGYFIALFTPDDDLYERAAAWSLHLNEPLLVTEYVLLECVNSFSLPKDRPSAHALIEHVRADPTCEVVPASHQFFEAGLRLHRERPDKEWSLTDCISFALMGERGIRRALAYDHHFEQAGFEALLRRDPPTS
jgi:predicted nucleic acid-binding protein